MKRTFTILFTIFALGILVSGIWCVTSENSEKKPLKVPCYDKWNNQIIGAECIDEPISEAEKMLGAFMVIIFSLIGSCGVIYMGHELDKMKGEGYI